MEYIETELVFTSEENPLKTNVRNFADQTAFGNSGSGHTEVLGINIRLGNQPLVYNLNDFLKNRQPGSYPLNPGRDRYLVVHVISAVRTQGKARVDELQYCASAIDPEGLQTVDLIPKTRFNELLGVNFNVSGVLKISGETLFDIPVSVVGNLLSQFIDIGAGMQLQLSTSADFIGRFTYNVQVPIVQSTGIGSNSCTWILSPDEKKTPLLGDQLLIQSISVPAGCKRIQYTLSGSVKADKGIFWKQQEKRTQEFIIEVKLDQK